ncbi:MAG TPA: response regulator transcription factor [Flavipsychrobacter sp.]|nr:response regulator transcription factor [Flavipsychrobacter sp.]
MNEPITLYNILIADDHQLVIDGIKSLMANEDRYRIRHEATDGQQAMNILTISGETIDILLLDVSMPLLTGIEVCKMAKLQRPDIKVLLLSMYHNTSVIREALKAEADGYVLKNTGKEELIMALDKITNGGTFFSQDIMPILSQLVRKNFTAQEKEHTLTEREKEILGLIVQEFTSEEIGEKLFISKKTVEKHRSNILEKTGCKSTIGLVKYAFENGFAEL